MKRIVGYEKVEKVDYNNIVDCIVMAMKIGKEEYGNRRRLKEMVNDMGRFMNKNLDVYRIKGMLKNRGMVVEEVEEVGDVMVVKDWVVI